MSRLTATFPAGEAPVLSHLQEIAQTREQNVCPEPTLNHDNVIVNLICENSSHTKRRKLTSKVWKEFTKFEEKNGKVWAKCKHCKKQFDGSSKKGTTHLNNHLNRCQSRKKDEENGGKVAEHYHENGSLTNPIVPKGKFVINQELNQLDVTRAIIKYGFSKLNLIKPDILLVYEEEKEKLRKYLTTLSCRFSLAIRFGDGWLFMVLHFIDNNWELKQKAISFQFYDSYSSAIVKDDLLDWNIKKNICSVVMNDDSNEDREEIRRCVTEQGSLPFVGPLLSASCLADFLRSNCMNGQIWGIDKISKAFEYVIHPSNKRKFQSAIETAELIMGKKVISRSIPSLCYGFEGLETAVGFKEAFLELEVTDNDFKLINLSKEEWDKATDIYEFQKMLQNAARSLSETKGTTANGFFPKICELYLNLRLWEGADRDAVREIASRAKERFFDKYWDNYKLVLAVTVVLDPRFKLDIVERWYKEIFGMFADAHLKEIADGLTNAYNEYAKCHSKSLDEMGRPCTSSQNSELVLYLNEPKIPPVEELDILAWWRLNRPTFPILASMARDFLAIPVSSTAFTDSTSDTPMDDIVYCSGLTADIKAALVCTQNWLESSEK